ncbi:uncharacterized protein F5147DRAFT_209389 [Suillus discolor]|uniref:DUF6533 domain-containing protein n=1 Tax=Suillus discolor TaxID=1912936 RepID=A0A9P7F588_9AGAM|nr:uncharacterized protein F5147DRAFT_209389 [Suillus discolor]KAG2107159.1 hypothetical protein F5147DRAFT_209389 [Suillus discolor]
MTVVSNAPSWWPFISLRIFLSHWTVAAGLVVVYDWVLTLGQEIELIWRQRWSLMSVLYIAIRYIGIRYSVANVLMCMPMISLTDTVSIPQPSHSNAMNILICRGNIVYYPVNGITVVVTAMLCVIMITRLYAMYQRSRIILIILVIIFLAINIACGIIAAIALKHTVAGELIISGMYMCNFEYEGDAQLLATMVWMLNTVWEVLALCLAVWIAVKHFRDLRRLSPSTGSTIGDCFRVLIKSHVLYFASFVGVSSLQLTILSPEVLHSHSALILIGVLQILLSVQLFVLGPRLILSVREHYAKLVANSDAETSMNSIVFQERVHVPTSSTV